MATSLKSIPVFSKPDAIKFRTSRHRESEGGRRYLLKFD